MHVVQKLLASHCCKARYFCIKFSRGFAPPSNGAVPGRRSASTVCQELCQVWRRCRCVRCRHDMLQALPLPSAAPIRCSGSPGSVRTDCPSQTGHPLPAKHKLTVLIAPVRRAISYLPGYTILQNQWSQRFVREIWDVQYFMLSRRLKGRIKWTFIIYNVIAFCKQLPPSTRLIYNYW